MADSSDDPDLSPLYKCPKQGCCSGDSNANTQASSFHLQDTLDSTPHVEQLQKDLREAASVGQALLARHEAYVASAESQHQSDASTIDSLITRSDTAEAENTRLRTENEELLKQVSTLNEALEESDHHVKNLTATLRDTQSELARMRVLTARAERFEQQLIQVEMERQILQDTVAKSEAEERRANARWASSERMLRDLEAQIENMETEAREQQEAQREVAGRAERQRQIQNHIESHRQRSTKDNGHEVIASFVKDVLEDNAGLHLDVAELREMLVRSQEEAEELRQQLYIASPLPQPDPFSATTSTHPTDLGSELFSQATSIGTRELHVHHHIHAPRQPSPLSATAQRPLRPMPIRHRRHMSSRSSIKTLHSRHESTASSAPSTIFENASSASEAGYETDATSFTRPTSPEVGSPGEVLSPLTSTKPLSEILEEHSKRPHSMHRRRGSTESVLSVSGMDIHAPPLPSSKDWSMSSTQNGRPVLSKSYASGSASSVRSLNPGESAAGQALRKRLDERERDRQKRYNPVRDTFGGWFAKSNKAQEMERRRPAARAITEVIDEDGLKECLMEEENEE